MLVVIGHPFAVLGPDGPQPGGPAAGAALTAARAGATVQLVGKLGDDDVGDALLVALARAGVGHAALLRDPSRPTPVVAQAAEAVEAEPGGAHRQPPGAQARPTLDAADVELALRYLADFRVVVVAEPLSDDILRVAASGAAYTEATLIVVVAEAADLEVPLPASAFVLAATHADGGEGLGDLLGEVAAAVDRGALAGDAFREAIARTGATPAD